MADKGIVTRRRGMPTEYEMKRTELAVIYEIRLIIDESEKETYTKDEIKNLLDQIAISRK